MVTNHSLSKPIATLGEGQAASCQWSWKLVWIELRDENFQDEEPLSLPLPNAWDRVEILWKNPWQWISAPYPPS